ncbi:MAG: butyrate kinase [Bacteroidota bacterium]|nr:butyrate kinase [Bacteroidota bacterium]
MVLGNILVIDPKNTSTRIAVFENSKMSFLTTIRHNIHDLSAFPTIQDQLTYRKEAILKLLRDNNFAIDEFEIIIARGGLTKPVSSGIYAINEAMKRDLRIGVMGQHATNLGGLLASELSALTTGARAITADPGVMDELDEVARLSGHPLFQRKSVFHALNQKSVARKYAKSISKQYEDLNLIVVHVGGGGISVGAHRKGRVVDVNQCYDGDGPFSLERSGSLPVGDLVRLCFSGDYTQTEIMQMITTHGGMMGYLGTTNFEEIERKINEGDNYAAFILSGMAYQVAKEVGAMVSVFEEQPDAILLSGELFHSPRFGNYLFKRIQRFAPVSVFPNEDEIDALAENAIRVLKQEVEILQYS